MRVRQRRAHAIVALDVHVLGDLQADRLAGLAGQEVHGLGRREAALQIRRIRRAEGVGRERDVHGGVEIGLAKAEDGEGQFLVVAGISFDHESIRDREEDRVVVVENPPEALIAGDRNRRGPVGGGVRDGDREIFRVFDQEIALDLDVDLHAGLPGAEGDIARGQRAADEIGPVRGARAKARDVEIEADRLGQIAIAQHVEAEDRGARIAFRLEGREEARAFDANLDRQKTGVHIHVQIGDIDDIVVEPVGIVGRFQRRRAAEDHIGLAALIRGPAGPGRADDEIADAVAVDVARGRDRLAELVLLALEAREDAGDEPVPGLIDRRLVQRIQINDLGRGAVEGRLPEDQEDRGLAGGRPVRAFEIRQGKLLTREEPVGPRRRDQEVVDAVAGDIADARDFRAEAVIDPVAFQDDQIGGIGIAHRLGAVDVQPVALAVQVGVAVAVDVDPVRAAEIDADATGRILDGRIVRAERDDVRVADTDIVEPVAVDVANARDDDVFVCVKILRVEADRVPEDLLDVRAAIGRVKTGLEGWIGRLAVRAEDDERTVLDNELGVFVAAIRRAVRVIEGPGRHRALHADIREPVAIDVAQRDNAADGDPVNAVIAVIAAFAVIAVLDVAAPGRQAEAVGAVQIAHIDQAGVAQPVLAKDQIPRIGTVRIDRGHRIDRKRKINRRRAAIIESGHRGLADQEIADAVAIDVTRRGDVIDDPGHAVDLEPVDRADVDVADLDLGGKVAIHRGIPPEEHEQPVRALVLADIIVDRRAPADDDVVDAVAIDVADAVREGAQPIGKGGEIPALRQVRRIARGDAHPVGAVDVAEIEGGRPVHLAEDHVKLAIIAAGDQNIADAVAVEVARIGDMVSCAIKAVGAFDRQTGIVTHGSSSPLPMTLQRAQRIARRPHELSFG